MKIIKKTARDYLAKIHTQSNRDFGIFLLFLGIVGSFPLYYIALIALKSPSRDLRPALWISLVLILLGTYLIWGSFKKIYINSRKLTIKDGLFSKAINYQISPEEEKYVKIKCYETESHAMPLEMWQIYFVSGDHEFLIDNRPNQQLETHQLGEALAKILNCPLVDTTLETGTLTISPADLDLPFKDRVLKYRGLLGKPIKKPIKLYFKIKKTNFEQALSWGIASSRLFLEISLFLVIVLIFSFIPLKSEQASFYQICVSASGFLFYHILGIIFVTFMIVLGGYKANLILKAESVEFKETIWGIPYRVSYIPSNKVEEINLYSGMRGSKVQIISDKKIIQIRVYNKENANWLAFIIKKHLTETQ